MRQPWPGHGRGQSRAGPYVVGLLRSLRFGYDESMASERMMQAICTLERTVSRLEQDVAHYMSAAASPGPKIDVPAAHAALRSLDALIDELKGRTDG